MMPVIPKARPRKTKIAPHKYMMLNPAFFASLKLTKTLKL